MVRGLPNVKRNSVLHADDRKRGTMGDVNVMKRIKSTKGQRDELRKLNPGVGFVVYNMGNGQTCEFEFYLDRNHQPRFITNGKPIDFEIYESEEV